MTQSGYSSALVNVMLGWLKALASWVLKLFNLAGGGLSPLMWLSQHWMQLLVFCLAAGVAMDFIVWMDYTSPHPEKSFGLLDEETNCYIELPMEWEGNLKLTDSEQYDGAVELRTVDEDQLVMTLRLVRTTSSLKGWTRLGIVASRQMQAKLAPDVEIRDKNYRLSKALYLLN